MSPRQLLAALAAALIIGGLVLGFRTISTDNISCGSVLAPSDSGAKQADYGNEIAGTLEGADATTGSGSNVAACDSAVSDAKPIAYGALGLGGVALIASLMASSAKPVNADGSPKPSIWR